MLFIYVDHSLKWLLRFLFKLHTITGSFSFSSWHILWKMLSTYISTYCRKCCHVTRVYMSENRRCFVCIAKVHQDWLITWFRHIELVNFFGLCLVDVSPRSSRVTRSSCCFLFDTIFTFEFRNRIVYIRTRVIVYELNDLLHISFYNFTALKLNILWFAAVFKNMRWLASQDYVLHDRVPQLSCKISYINIGEQVHLRIYMT